MQMAVLGLQRSDMSSCLSTYSVVTGHLGCQETC